MLLGGGGAKDDIEVGPWCHALADGCLKGFDGLIGFLLHEIPLVDKDHKAFLVALDNLEDIHILRLDAALCVDKEDADIAVFNSADRTHDGVKLEVFTYLVLAANASCVNEVEVEAELVITRINGVARGAGDVGDDVALLSDEGVGEAALTYVGAAYNSKTRQSVVVRFAALAFFKFANYEVEQVAGATACKS